MTGNKKGPAESKKEKHVEKLTDQDLDKVSGGIKIGCGPTSTPCEPKSGVGCLPTSTPCEPKHKVGCQPSWSPCEPKGRVGCGPTATPK